MLIVRGWKRCGGRENEWRGTTDGAWAAARSVWHEGSHYGDVGREVGAAMWLLYKEGR